MATCCGFDVACWQDSCEVLDICDFDLCQIDSRDDFRMAAVLMPHEFCWSALQVAAMAACSWLAWPDLVIFSVQSVCIWVPDISGRTTKTTTTQWMEFR